MLACCGASASRCLKQSEGLEWAIHFTPRCAPLQTEYNKLKPTQRNEFQGSNLKTAFRPGMQRGKAGLRD